MEFEWIPDKAIRNIQIHNISFTEAASVFNDPLSLTYPVMVEEKTLTPAK